MSDSEVYRYPHYYAIGYRWNTDVECAFIEACLKTYSPSQAKRVLDIGCGAGRHMLMLSKRGYHVSGIDVRREMVDYVREEAQKAKLKIDVAVGDLRQLEVQETVDVAICFMDTFRFLLTNEEIVEHLRRVAKLLVSGGLYLIDFWVPSQWDRIGDEIHQWEQTEGDTTVRVFYLQHPDSVDPVNQTFEDELVFEVHEGDEVKEIRGGPTRTRLLLPQEFRALVENSQAFELLSTHGEFDVTKPLDRSSLSWRMISVLRKC